MKWLYSFMLIVIVCASRGQGFVISPASEIYNFSVGDSFEYYNSGYVASSSYYYDINELKVIIDKQLTSTLLTYKIRRIQKRFGNPNIQIDTIQFTENPHDSILFINHNYLCPCDSYSYNYSITAGFNDTVYKGYTSCQWGGSAYHSNSYVRGLGEVSVTQTCTDKDEGQSHHVDLKYYHKMDGRIWGTPVYLNLPDVLSNGLDVTITPNPANDQLVVNLSGSTKENADIIFRDILGNIVHREKVTSLTTTVNSGNLSAGIFLWTLEINGVAYKSGKVILR